MIAAAQKRQLAKSLQNQINQMQGLGKVCERAKIPGLELFAEAFPDRVFPLGALHEMISYEQADAACTNGFIAALMGHFAKQDGLCLWVGTNREVFPAGIAPFGLPPDRIIFITVKQSQEALWVVEEALKCEALSAVVAQINQFGFTESRRFQLVVEKSGVTCFIYRSCPLTENATACTARWNITPLPRITPEGLPGLGYSSWQVNLLKLKNGRPASWQVSWQNRALVPY